MMDGGSFALDFVVFSFALFRGPSLVTSLSSIGLQKTQNYFGFKFYKTLVGLKVCMVHTQHLSSLSVESLWEYWA